MVDRSTSPSKSVAGAHIARVPSGVHRIDHVAIAVRDADIAAAGMIATFGLRPTGDVVSPDGLVRLLYLDAAETTIQLVQPMQPGPVATWLEANGEGLHHICFSVPDLADALEGLGQGPDVRIAEGGRGCPVAFLAAPVHGVLIELTEIADALTRQS